MPAVAEVLDQLGPVFRWGDARRAGLSDPMLHRLLSEGRLERISHGLYRQADVEVAEMRSGNTVRQLTVRFAKGDSAVPIDLGVLAAGGYTAYYYYKVYEPGHRAAERRSRRRARADEPTAVLVAPYATSDGGGLAVAGSF
jgi:hypothetical protein